MTVHDNLFLADIDECILNDTLCHQVCVNTDGSYFCDCLEGYQLIADTDQCEGIKLYKHDIRIITSNRIEDITIPTHSYYPDVNECEGVNDCQQVCENTMGSYTCSCMEGFTLAEDGRNCTGIVLVLGQAV